jgi:hypothetical protein
MVIIHRPGQPTPHMLTEMTVSVMSPCGNVLNVWNLASPHGVFAKYKFDIDGARIVEYSP